jgi:hypothetical protein
MRLHTAALRSAFALFLGCCVSHAAKLLPETLTSWNDYVTVVQTQSDNRVGHDKPFLRVDETPELRSRIEQGEIVVHPVESGEKKIRSGLIHHWTGVIFIPHATIDEVIATSREYERYSEIYAPSVVAGKLIGTNGDQDRFSMRFLNHALVSQTALDAEYITHFQRIDPTRAITTTWTEAVYEIQNYGHPNEAKLAPDQGHGYIWRLESTARMRQSQTGVMLELETLALSRDVPVSLHWVVEPVIKRVSRSSLSKALEQTKTAVEAKHLSAHR